MTKRARQHEKAGRVTDSDGYKHTPVPDSHRATTAAEVDDIRIVNSLMKRKDWQIPDRAYLELPEDFTTFALNEENDPGDRVKAARLITLMHGQNQKNEEEKESERQAPETNQDYELRTLEELQALGLLVPDRQGAVIKGMNGNGKG